jgi:hypothetical protein
LDNQRLKIINYLSEGHFLVKLDGMQEMEYCILPLQEYSIIYIMFKMWGPSILEQGDSTHTLVFTIKTQKSKFFLKKNLDIKFSFRIHKLI